MMEAHFSSYEEFSSSLVLLPYIDDSCVGAKVCSHNPSVKNNNTADAAEKSNDAPEKILEEEVAEDEGLPENINDSREEVNVAVNDNDANRGGGEQETISNESGSKNDNNVADAPQDQDTKDTSTTIIQIPADHVLTAMKAGDNEIEEGLEFREFTELLTLLREATYPLSLTFVPPDDVAVAVSDCSTDQGSSSSSDSDNDEAMEEQSPSTSINTNDNGANNNELSVDDATAYAKQAASELRGRLGRWGMQAASIAATRAAAAAEVAATRAAAAKSAVQELREGKSKEDEKVNDETDNNKESSTSDWLPKVEAVLSDEETTLETSSSNDNEISESSDCQIATNSSQDDDNDEHNDEHTKQEIIDGDKENDVVENKDVEDPCLDTPRVKQLETQLATQTTALNKLQQKLDTCTNERTKIEKESMQCKKELEAKLNKSDKTIFTLTDELQIITKALTNCEAELEEKRKNIETLIARNSEKELEHAKAMKALNNELSVCKAAVEARDSKVANLTESVTELKKKLSEQSQELAAVESLRLDLTQSKTLSSTADKVIEKMKKEESEFQKELKEANGIVNDLNKKYATAKAAASKSSAEVEKFKSDYRRILMERNSLKNKAESLQKEMNSIAKMNEKNKVDSSAFAKLQEEFQRLRLEHTELQRDLDAERTEKRELTAELNATRLAHQNPIINYQPTAESDGSPRIEELERIISEMTEYSSAQALQIETLRQINAALTEDITKNAS
jgi:chromosome segregation ATPase